VLVRTGGGRALHAAWRVERQRERDHAAKRSPDDDRRLQAMSSARFTASAYSGILAPSARPETDRDRASLARRW